MSTQTEDRIFQLYKSALLLSKKDRLAFLKEACGRDLNLLSDVEDRLRAAEQVQRNMQSIANVLPLGTQIGPYTIESTLGAGGMGTIFLAHQKEPVERQVALKFMAWHMDESSKIRFLAECQHLASLSHSHIGKFYDVETSPRGITYFVMEYLEGLTFNRYLQEHSPNVKKRLDLFLQICRGVSHAHLKGIIHRDLKPSNIMIIQEDGSPIAKVIDFGIALSLNRDFNLTADGHPIGSYPYMSPEQAGLKNTKGYHDIDFRSDVYAMGVILYELIIGKTPLEWNTGTHVATILKAICEKPVRPPSFHEHSFKNQLSLHKQKELDWIVLKALEKDPENRYLSIEALHEDLHRFLKDFPLSVGPPSFRYQISKLWRRHKTLGIFGSSIAFTIILSITLISWALIKSNDAKHLALEEQKKTKNALVEAQTSNQLLASILAAPHPNLQGDKVLIVDVLKDAERKLESLDELPFQKGSLSLVLAESHFGLGQYQEAKRLALDSQKIFSSLTPLRLDQWERSQLVLARSHFRLADLGHAETWFLSLIKLRLPHSAPTKYTVYAFNGLAGIDQARGDYKGAESFSNEAKHYQEKFFPDDLGLESEVLGEIANALFFQYRLEEAEHCYQRVLDFQRPIFGEMHAKTAVTMNNLANCYRARGCLTEAEALFEKVISIRSSILSEGHHHTLSSIHGLAEVLMARGENKKALLLFEEVWKKRFLALGVEHPDTLGAMNNLALAFRANNRLVEAASMLQSVVDIYQSIGQGRHHRALRAMNNLGDITLKVSGPEQAIPILQDALMISETNLGDTHSRTIIIRCTLAEAVLALGEFETAEAMFLKTLDDARQQFGSESTWYGLFESYFAKCLMAIEQENMAEKLIMNSQILLSSAPEEFRKVHDEVCLAYLEQNKKRANPHMVMKVGPAASD